MIVYESETPTDVDYTDYGSYLEKSPEEVAKCIADVTKRHQDIFQRLIATYGRNAKVLDFGSGAGYFAYAAARTGLDAYGVEISQRLVDFSINQLGFTQVRANISDYPFKFDAIFMSNVIEHLDPTESRVLMSSLIERLSDHGILIGSTPNFQSLNVLLCGERDPAIWPPYHKCYFNPRSLDRYFNSLDLTRVSLMTRSFSTNSFFRPSKNQPSFIELSLRQRLPFGQRILALGVRASFKIIGSLAGPAGLGYQIHFQYRKR